MSMKVNKVLPSPAELKEEYPLSEKLIQLKKERDAEIRDIFTGKSDKFAVFISRIRIKLRICMLELWQSVRCIFVQ